MPRGIPDSPSMFWIPFLVFILVGITGTCNLLLGRAWNQYEDSPTPVTVSTPTHTPIPVPVPPTKTTLTLTMPWDNEFWHYRGGWKIGSVIFTAVIALWVLLGVLLKPSDDRWMSVWVLGGLFSLGAWVPFVWLTWVAPLDQFDYEVAGEYEKAIEHWSLEICRPGGCL